ncbi:MAG: sulfurtransferase TusA family protein [Burkholderiales bacterium]|nr:sulfurtransferase TusA family protein [Burkholderiales bacterium]
METKTKPAVTLDLTGLSCPAPLLGAKRVLDDLEPGQTLLLVSDCPGTLDDLTAWVHHTDHELVATEKGEGRRTHYYVRKGHSVPIKANVVLDIRGVSCPGPIVEAKKIVEGMKPGEVLQLISSCPGSPADVRAWTKSTGHELLAARDTGRDVHEFFVRKR